MVKVFVKGGIWKNSEDEILKAAVMKYGKQQWARVASLLNRKSAKQCKARWHEWLDPSVKKLEWSRQEEEKLLHLAKLLPAQWKTIGPLIGRTATQCQEHYEYLLDQAATDGKDDQQDGDSIRKSSLLLQAGQIDVHPETRPARPDPMDMEEDEMEMLQEARARLANTQGKKAKRKAREKMLAQAKRLADLQKRRELKQAGIFVERRQRRSRKEIDLGNEIPFFRAAPSGFHDTSLEQQKSAQLRARRHASVNYKQVNENQYRSRDREAAQAAKREEVRQKMLEQTNLQAVIQKVSQVNDGAGPTQLSRGTLTLPEPNVDAKEWQQVAKAAALQQQQSASAAAAATNGTNQQVTQALLGDYSNRPLPTPMRTPMAASAAGNAANQTPLMQQASQLRQLQQQRQTPLLGPFLGGEEGDGGNDDDDDDRKMAAVATPNVFNNEEKKKATSATPSHAVKQDRTASNPTPHRDALGLNTATQDDAASIAAWTHATSTANQTMSLRELARAERRAAKKARQDLEAALAALPEPQFEYELAAPPSTVVSEEDEEDGNKKRAKRPDAADVQAKKQREKETHQEEMLEARSSVLKRQDLPRPVYFNALARALDDKNDKDDILRTAQQLITTEMSALIQHDAHAYPEKKRRKMANVPRSRAIELSLVDKDALESAKQLVQTEYQDVVLKEREAQYTEILSQSGAEKSTTTPFSQSVLQDVLEKQSIQVSRETVDGMQFEDEAGWQPMEKSNQQQQKLKSLPLEFQTLREATMNLRKRNNKTAKKLGIQQGGYQKRCQTLLNDISQGWDRVCQTKLDLETFSRLADMERAGGQQRLEQLQNEVEELQKDEMMLQKEYGDLLLLQRKRKQTQGPR